MKSPAPFMSLLFSLSAVFILVFAVVLFPDFLPFMDGSYAGQRFVGAYLFVIGGAVLFSYYAWVHRVLSILGQELLFFSLFLTVVSVSFIFLDVFERVEALYYFFFFCLILLWGQFLSRQGLALSVATSFIVVMLTACFLYSAMTINVYLFALAGDFSRLDRVIPWGFVNIRFWSNLATWLILLMPLAVLVGPLKNHRLWRAAVAFTAAMWWWIVFLTTSRGSMVGLVLGAVSAAVIFGRLSWPWGKLCLTYLLYGFVAWVFLSLWIPGLVFDDASVRGIKGHSSGRMPLWHEAWAMSLQNFPFGMGPQSWLTHEIITESYQNSRKFASPHNMYLMWAAEYGWVAVLGLGLVGLAGIRRVWRAREALMIASSARSSVLVAFTGATIAGLVEANFSGVFLVPASMLVGMLVMTIFWGLLEADSKASRQILAISGLSALGLRLALVMTMVGGGGLWLHDVQYYYQKMRADLPYYEMHVREGLQPRFWYHGNFPRHPDQMPPPDWTPPE